MTDVKFTQELSGTGGRYVAHVAGTEDAELTFADLGAGVRRIDHVRVPVALEGKGVGRALVEFAVARAREDRHRLVPRCPFAAAQFKRHADWADVLAEDEGGR